MSRRTKWIGALLGGAAIVVVAAGVLAFSLFSNASAKAAANRWVSFGAIGQKGWPGFLGNGPTGQEALAKALGISVTDLQTAEQKASDAAIQQAVDKGLITQDQADALILHGFGFPFGHGFEGRGLFGANSGIDYNALLAEALGISADKLTAAQQQAESDLLAQAVANGTLTQQQADMIKAQQALQSYIDPNALFAQALGITTDQLQSYRDQGLTLSQILAKVGKTAVEVRDAEQAAYQAAVQKAVSDGAITQDQADQFLANGFRGFGGFEFGPGFGGGRGFHGGRGFGGFGGFRGGPWGRPNTAPNGTPNTTPTTPSATPGSGA